MLNPKFPDQGIVSLDVDSFYDPAIDYSRFTGRVTDKDVSENILKIESENKNIKFFKAGDEVKFRIARQDKQNDKCKGFVRGIEENYLILFVEDLKKCWEKSEYFRRGTMISFFADILKTRVVEASIYRMQLIRKKEDYLKQLNSINHFIWSFDQIKVEKAAEYDRRIIELQKQKQEALDRLLTEKTEKIYLQKELVYRANQTDESIKQYRVERQELFIDRWHLDQNLGVPVGKRPQAIRDSEASSDFD
ncbi:MAG: hypothetical protein U0T83_06090 [Bacteriovoracaceae bacterium]